MNRWITATAAVALTALTGLVACSSDGGSADEGPVQLTLVAYDSFPKEGTPLNDALDAFAADTGIAVDVVTAGDTGTMVSKAVLTAGNPEGDVMWGVDNTMLSAAQDGEIFDGDPTHVDFGDVCVNYDIEWFVDNDLELPSTLDDLTRPEYANLLVVQDPSTSSPGLAFLLATVAKFGDDGWKQYWTDLAANGVTVVESWETAYYEEFSGSAGSSGTKPLVVSYASSPPAEVIFADPPVDTAPTGVAYDTCFRQLEYAGVLRGTDHPDAAAQLVQFLASEPFQKELPLTLFVYPVDPNVALPEVFTTFAAVPTNPFTMESDRIDANRRQWQEQWAEIVQR